MKRKVKILALVMICLTCAFFSACSCSDEPREIVLGFDRSNAYFTGTKALMPIAGALPASGDIYEEATVIITADESVKMRLTATFSESAIDKLMVSIDTAAAIAFTSGTVLYESAQPETQAEINVKLFLAADADPAKSAGKQLAFSFELAYYTE